MTGMTVIADIEPLLNYTYLFLPVQCKLLSEAMAEVVGPASGGYQHFPCANICQHDYG